MHPTKDPTINHLARTRVQDCYQCGKCSAGCPVAEAMDLMPHQVVLLAQQNDLDRAARAAAPWVCVACQTCTERCPKGVDPAAVMDAVRRRSAQRGLAPVRVRRTLAFQRAFLETIRRHGRVNELELIARFKARGLTTDGNLRLLVKDAGLAPRLMRVHKLHVRGEHAADTGVVRRIFERCSGED